MRLLDGLVIFLVVVSDMWITKFIYRVIMVNYISKRYLFTGELPSKDERAKFL